MGLKSQVPAYIGAQVIAAISVGFVLRLMFGEVAHIAATVPTGSDTQSFVLEILITFFLMFVVSAVSTDTKAVSISDYPRFFLNYLYSFNKDEICLHMPLNFLLQ